MERGHKLSVVIIICCVAVQDLAGRCLLGPVGQIPRPSFSSPVSLPGCSLTSPSSHLCIPVQVGSVLVFIRSSAFLSTHSSTFLSLLLTAHGTPRTACSRFLLSFWFLVFWAIYCQLYLLDTWHKLHCMASTSSQP